MEDKKTYRVTGIPVRHSGKVYPKGEKVEMTGREAERLGGLLEEIDAETSASVGTGHTDPAQKETQPYDMNTIQTQTAATKETLTPEMIEGMDYAALKEKVAELGLEVKDKRAETLKAALTATLKKGDEQ